MCKTRSPVIRHCTRSRRFSAHPELTAVRPNDLLIQGRRVRSYVVSRVSILISQRTRRKLEFLCSRDITQCAADDPTPSMSGNFVGINRSRSVLMRDWLLDNYMRCRRANLTFEGGTRSEPEALTPDEDTKERRSVSRPGQLPRQALWRQYNDEIHKDRKSSFRPLNVGGKVPTWIALSSTISSVFLFLVSGRGKYSWGGNAGNEAHTCVFPLNQRSNNETDECNSRFQAIVNV